MPETTVERTLEGEAATHALAGAVAALARPGDVIGLAGELGAGKTSFARGFIRARAARCGAGPVGEVPSPTFTLVQIYDLPGGAVWHVDLYRLDGAEEARELGIEDAFGDAITLIEWPERAAALLPAGRLDVELAFADRPERRHARLTGRGTWAERLARLGAHG